MDSCLLTYFQTNINKFSDGINYLNLEKSQTEFLYANAEVLLGTTYYK